MCGINGIFSHSGTADLFTVVEKMNESLLHRGPDDKGIFIDSEVILGHRRLSIIDLSKAGHQPMQSSDGRYEIVFNGEIYNFREIKNELINSGDHLETFISGTDTEVLLAAFRRWGVNCLEKLNGMFAFAIWDKQEKKLFIARDRMGIKPLYYYHTDQFFLFSSELRPLLKSGLVPKKADRAAIVDYLRYQTVHAPYTIIQGVKVLMPGHYLMISDEDFVIKKYWAVSENPLDNRIDLDYSATCKKVKQLFFEAVERRLIADVPFGAFLSGGIDSSAVVGAMAQISNTKVNTFNVFFEEEEFTEQKYAQIISKKFNTDHHSIKLNPNEFLDLLPAALAAMDHPSGDGPNTYLISKKTKEAGITMALSGLGGDEIFAGYDVFKKIPQIKDKRWLLSFPKYFRRIAASAIKTINPGVASDKTAELLLLDYFDMAEVYPISRQVLLDDVIFKLLKKTPLSTNRVMEIVINHLSYEKKGFQLPMLSKISVAELSTYLQNVLLRDTDQMSMAHALEVRVPFMDHKLVEYVLAVPDHFKYPSTPKKMLVDSLGEMLPPEIVNRPKMGFTLPWQKWMRNELKSFVESGLNSLAQLEYFDEKEIHNLWKRFLNNDPRITWSRIWYLAVLGEWLQKNEVE
jgi:asparagine synthase (glutamine-hydrolysing)